MSISATTPPSTSRRTRLRRRAAYVAGALVGTLVLALASGAVYETIASASEGPNAPQVGRLVDVGGHLMHIDCRGEGSPTVVMDAGLGGASLDWSLVQPALQATSRVCVYDRAGMGWSEPVPGLRRPSQLVTELHALLAAAGESRPYVMVGHSLAGKNVRLFAATFPDEVQGMVLVDARSEIIDQQMSVDDTNGFNAAIKGQSLIYSFARHFGLARLVGGALIGVPRVPAATAHEMVLLQTNAAAIDETYREGIARSVDDDVLAGQTLGNLPLMVIAAEDSMTSVAGWVGAQEALAHLSTNGSLVVATGSGHYVQLEQPDLVTAAINQVVSAARARP
jgi:pimeloyl-ACP methyl ester carboxylesterase